MEVQEDIDLKLAKVKLKLMLEEDKRRAFGEKKRSTSQGEKPITVNKVSA